ncbi:MAG: hypothetical protein RL757_2120 [Bacteroidota bacterium]|jgi:hypothetical protein
MFSLQKRKFDYFGIVSILANYFDKKNTNKYIHKKSTKCQ